MQQPATDLRLRGERGDPDAQIALGRYFEAQTDNRAARAWFARAARNGNAEAMRALAVNLLSREPIAGAEGVNIMQDAAQHGDAQAAYLCGLIAAQDPGLENRWEVALARVRDAASRGWAPARKELAALASAQGDAAPNADLDLSALAAAMPMEALSESPRIFTIGNCLPPVLCDWLMAETRPRLRRALVYDPVTVKGRIESDRSNSQKTFQVVDANLVLMLLRAKMAALAGLSEASLERTSILNYAVGEQFTPHCDYFDAANPAYAREIARSGQRAATLLVYLNDEYEGGETAFLKLGLQHRGRKGDGLLFWNVDADGNPDPMTFHAGLPPTRGEKWIVSQWLRTGPQAVAG
jgi:prolyl 4-hydroxylase